MAGTTVDENNIVYKTLHKIINDAGFIISYDQVLAEAAGKEKLIAIKDCIQITGQSYDEGQLQNLYNSFLEVLAFSYQHAEIRPQEGVEDVFEALRKEGIRVIINTGYNEMTAISILEKLQWEVGVQFDCLITASDVQHNRPQPDMILLAMEKFSIDNAIEVVKVGDSVVDIEEGKNAGCGLSIGITTGAHTRQQLALANPDNIIDHLQELLPLIEIYAGSSITG